jgi:hypothetical protein
MTRCVLVAIALLIPVVASAQSPGKRDPNWPCQQIKVSELSLASVWSGPPVEPNDDHWRANAAVTELVDKLAPRRQSIDQTQTLIEAFASHASADKQAQLLQVLVGLFNVLGTERESVIAGLDRFGARQKELAAEIRSNNERLRALQSDPTADPHAVQQLTQQITWQVELFQDRRQAISYACDVPGKIEQHLFALARQIQQALN